MNFSFGRQVTCLLSGFHIGFHLRRDGLQTIWHRTNFDTFSTYFTADGMSAGVKLKGHLPFHANETQRAGREFLDRPTFGEIVLL
jgi:hypothetical protein